MEPVLVTLDGQALIVQLLYLLVQRTAQVMVAVIVMEAVVVTLDGKVMIVQLLQDNPVQTTA